MSKPLISIIVPVYNGESFVKRCYDTIRSQTYENLEIIFIDDGSEDSSLRLCNEISESDERVHVISQKNYGVSITRRKGIEEAKGEYIAFVDVDDYVSNDYIETLYLTMTENNADCSVVDYYINENELISTKSSNSGVEEVLQSQEAINNMFNPIGVTGYLWNKLFRKAIIVSNRISFNENVSVWEDMLFCLEYFVHCSKIVYKNTAKYYYVQNQSSLVHKPEILIERSKYNALEAMLGLLNNNLVKCTICEKLFCEYCLKMFFHGEEGISKAFVIDSLNKYKPKLSFKHSFLSFAIKNVPILSAIIVEYGKRKCENEKSRNLYNTN